MFNIKNKNYNIVLEKTYSDLEKFETERNASESFNFIFKSNYLTSPRIFFVNIFPLRHELLCLLICST